MEVIIGIAVEIFNNQEHGHFIRYTTITNELLVSVLE